VRWVVACLPGRRGPRRWEVLLACLFGGVLRVGAAFDFLLARSWAGVWPGSGRPDELMVRAVPLPWNPSRIMKSIRIRTYSGIWDLGAPGRVNGASRAPPLEPLQNHEIHTNSYVFVRIRAWPYAPGPGLGMPGLFVRTGARGAGMPVPRPYCEPCPSPGTPTES